MLVVALADGQASVRWRVAASACARVSTTGWQVPTDVERELALSLRAVAQARFVAALRLDWISTLDRRAARRRRARANSLPAQARWLARPDARRCGD